MRGNLILIPAFNEEKNLGNVIEKFSKYGETLVIDDGSKDNTYKIAKAKSNYIIKNKINKGYDRVIKQGFNFAFNHKYKYLITVDGDGQHIEKYVKIFFNLLKKYDIIVGNRSFYNRKIEKVICNLSFKIYNIKDPLTGFKAYNLKKIKKIWKHVKTNENQYGMFFLTFIKKVKVKNYKINVKRKNKISSMGLDKKIERNFFISFLKIIKNEFI